MKFLFADAMINPSFWVPLAKAVEEAGFHGMTLPDSLCYPEISDSKYPYTPDGDRAFLENKPFLDPFVQVAAMGTVTTTLRFTTFVLKLPVRHPVIVAKQASSVAVLTNNRFDLGVGVSPWPDDYRITGVPWKGRGRRMDECIDIINGLMTGEYYEHKGSVFEIESIKICPVPTEPIPLLIGGHSQAALRRAARVGSGWLHAGGDFKQLTEMIGQLNGYREEAGRSHEPFDIRVIGMEAYSKDGIKTLEDAGVTHVIVGFRNAYSKSHDKQSLQQKIDMLNGYAERIIHNQG